MLTDYSSYPAAPPASLRALFQTADQESVALTNSPGLVAKKRLALPSKESMCVDVRRRQVAARRTLRPADRIDPGLVSVRGSGWPGTALIRRTNRCPSNLPIRSL